MNNLFKALSVAVVTLGLFAGSAEVSEVSAAKKSDPSFFTKVSRTVKKNVKKTAKKTKRAVIKTGAAAQNAVVDSAVKAKSCITGKKAKKTFVKGHYKKGNKTLTNGHFRKVSGGKK
jgi:hypothetical protein